MWFRNDAALLKTSTPNCAPSFTIARRSANSNQMAGIKGDGDFGDNHRRPRPRTRIIHPLSCDTRFDRRVMADDISRTLSPQAQFSWQVGLFVQALDVYAILLQELVACAARSLRERVLAEP